MTESDSLGHPGDSSGVSRLQHLRVMRFVTFLFGLLIGVGGTIGYSLYASSTPATSAPVPTAPANAPITLVLGEPFLTGLVRHAAEDSKAVPDTKVVLGTELKGQDIIVHAKVDVLGRTTDSSATLRPELRAGRLHVSVVETNLGDLAIPAIDQVLEQQINARVDSLLTGMPVTITGVGVDARGLVVTCAVDLDRLGTKPNAGG